MALLGIRVSVVLSGCHLNLPFISLCLSLYYPSPPFFLSPFSPSPLFLFPPSFLTLLSCLLSLFPASLFLSLFPLLYTPTHTHTHTHTHSGTQVSSLFLSLFPLFNTPTHTHTVGLRFLLEKSTSGRDTLTTLLEPEVSLVPMNRERGQSE